jgi:cobalt/nickel transport protein
MRKKEIFLGLCAALLLAFFFSPFASEQPDGLERAAEDKGFLEKGEVAPALTFPLPDYAWPRLENARLGTSLAGAAGTLIVFASGYGIAALLRKK